MPLASWGGTHALVMLPYRLSVHPPLLFLWGKALVFAMSSAASALDMNVELKKTVAADLLFLLDREGVDAELQKKVYEAGILSVRQFAVTFKDTEDLRYSAKEYFGVDPSKGLADKVRLSRFLVAFESAKVRSAKLADWRVKLPHAKYRRRSRSMTSTR